MKTNPFYFSNLKIDGHRWIDVEEHCEISNSQWMMVSREKGKYDFTRIDVWLVGRIGTFQSADVSDISPTENRYCVPF